MAQTPLTRLAAGAALAALMLAGRLSADVVETRNGARIVGQITKIDGGSVYVATSYAGDLVIKQSEVTGIQTDQPISVRLASGTRIDGQVRTTDGTLRIAGADGTILTSVSKVAATWPEGGKDPALVALERHWKYEATVDIDGTTGNKNQLGTQAGFAAKLVTPQDALTYYTSYNRQVTDGEKSADQLKAGVDYANNFEDRSSWYVNDETGFDRIMDIRLYDTAAVGYGYDLIKNPIDTLTARAGLAYRYDGYRNPLTPTVNSAAADFEIDHDLKLPNWELVNKLTAVPAFSNMKDVIVGQDSFYQVPLVNPAWKLRVGVANQYNSEPGAGIQKLDTTYYTRLILDWQ
jgi:putative salt-induced outer membrane protein YdiY